MNYTNKNRSLKIEIEKPEISAKSKQIFEDNYCTIHSISNHFEVWAKLAGRVTVPNDESFGLWAWNAYTLQRAQLIAHEIKTGKRTVEIVWREAE